MNLFKETRKNLSEILSKSIAYGLPKIFKSKSIFFIKIFWLIFILFCIITSVYFTVEVIPNKIHGINNPWKFLTIKF
jgi:hypothetical protein